MPKSKHRVKDRNQRSRKARDPIPRAQHLSSFNIVRSRKTFLIDSSKIHVPDWMAEDDEIFLRLYRKYLLGKMPGYMTRMPIALIKEGFYVANRNFEYVCDQPPEEVILGSIRQLRMGSRPPLHLYQNVNSNDPIRFLCPDDVSSCLAYRRLNFETVPCIVFAPGNTPLPFSSFEIRVSAAGATHYLHTTKVVPPPASEMLDTSFGITLPSDPLVIMETLDEKLAVVVQRLKSFHTSHESELHYHHMLFSALIRIKETLDAISVLIRSNLWYQALALLRVVYEIHLNFCFDWLQPETNYQYLAAAAVFTNSDIARNRVEAARHYVSEGMDKKSAEERAYNAWKPVVFAASIVEKAKLSMVGIHYHRSIYDFLSQISHQNFEIASLHANRFDDETFTAVEDDVKETYLRFTDFIVTEFLRYVVSDIGEVKDAMVIDE